MRYSTYLYTLISVIPSVALAQTAPPATTYQLIAPIGTLTGSVNLTQYLNGVFVTAIGLAGFLAVIMMVFCGVKLMGSGSVSGKTEAKQCIYNAIFGVLLAIGSWLILYTINPLLLKNDLPITVVAPTTPSAIAVAGTPGGPAAITQPIPTDDGWYYRYTDVNGNTLNSSKHLANDTCTQLLKANVEKATSEGKPITVVAGPDGTLGCFYIAKSPPPTSSSETGTRNLICGNDSCVPNKNPPTNSNSYVLINKPPCEPYTAKYTLCKPGTGTNVGGLPTDTVNFIKSLATPSRTVLITGGTENGHASHGDSIPVFDLSKTTQLYDFIKTNATVKDNPSFNGNKKFLYNGYWFTDEAGGTAPHWHVCKEGTTAPPGKSVELFRKACTKL